jgi:hypothetical protein
VVVHGIPTPWTSLGGVITSNLLLSGSGSDDSIELIARAADGTLERRTRRGNNPWSSWTPIYSPVTVGDPGVGTDLDGREELFVREGDGATWNECQLSGQPPAWPAAPAPPACVPSCHNECGEDDGCGHPCHCGPKQQCCFEECIPSGKACIAE